MGNSFQQKLAGISLHYQTLQLLKTSLPDTHCVCQFDTQTINNSPQAQSLILPQLTNICPKPGVSPEVVAKRDKNIGAGLEVKEIRATGIIPTGVTTLGFDSDGEA